MKKVSLVIPIVIIIGGIGFLGWKYYNEYNTNQQLNSEISQLGQKYDNQNEVNVQLKNERSKLEEDIHKSEDQNTELQNQNTELQENIEKLRDSKSDLLSQMREIRTELQSLKELTTCQDLPLLDISYTSNPTASVKLKDWVGDYAGSTVRASWEVVWTNSKVAMHKISTVKYLYIFLVYFDEPDMGRVKSVFYLSGRCWLETTESHNPE